MSPYLEEDWAELEKDSIIENLQIEKATLEGQVEILRSMLIAAGVRPEMIDSCLNS